MSEPIAWISALKSAGPDRPNHLTSCPIDDKDATHFRLGYPGMQYSSSTIDFMQEDYPREGMARYRAEQTKHAIERAFAAGRRSYAKDLRAFIGVKD